MKLKDDITALFNNKKDGSTTLLSKLNRIIGKEIHNKKYLELIIKESRSHFKPFSVIENYLKVIEKGLNNRDILLSIIKHYENYEVEVTGKIYRQSRKYFRNVSRILTFSNSLTISLFLIKLHEEKKDLSVIITESRPKNEGRIMAKTLLKNNIPVEFITDFSVGSYIPSIDAVITGADNILPNGNIINKTGSRTIAILCKYYRKPFYVISSQSKKSNEKEFQPEEKDTGEIWKYTNKNLIIKNTYFEEVEKKLITRVLTD